MTGSYLLCLNGSLWLCGMIINALAYIPPRGNLEILLRTFSHRVPNRGALPDGHPVLPVGKEHFPFHTPLMCSVWLVWVYPGAPIMHRVDIVGYCQLLIFALWGMMAKNRWCQWAVRGSTVNVPWHLWAWCKFRKHLFVLSCIGHVRLTDIAVSETAVLNQSWTHKYCATQASNINIIGRSYRQRWAIVNVRIGGWLVIFGALGSSYKGALAVGEGSSICTRSIFWTTSKIYSHRQCTHYAHTTHTLLQAPSPCAHPLQSKHTNWQLVSQSPRARWWFKYSQLLSNENASLMGFVHDWWGLNSVVQLMRLTQRIPKHQGDLCKITVTERISRGFQEMRPRWCILHCPGTLTPFSAIISQSANISSWW